MKDKRIIPSRYWYFTDNITIKTVNRVMSRLYDFYFKLPSEYVKNDGFESIRILFASILVKLIMTF